MAAASGATRSIGLVPHGTRWTDGAAQEKPPANDVGTLLSRNRRGRAAQNLPGLEASLVPSCIDEALRTTHWPDSSHLYSASVLPGGGAPR